MNFRFIDKIGGNMWFKKKQKENDKSTWTRVTGVDDLKKEIEKLQENNKTVNDEISKLRRIVKYSGSEPTYHLDFDVFFGVFVPSRRKYSLYIYVGKEEYIIELEELENESIDEDGCEFKVEGNFVYFNISSNWNVDGACDKWTRHEFIIDFKNGKYVHSSRDDEELNAKENVEVVIE